MLYQKWCIKGFIVKAQEDVALMEKMEINQDFDHEIIKAFEPMLGLSEIKKELMALAKKLKENSIAACSGDNEPSGLLLMGDHATGKTLLAKCLIQASGRKSYKICFDRPNRNWDNIIHSVFKEALDNAPSIVYLDDLETYSFENESNVAKIEKELMKCIDSVHGKHIFVLVTCSDYYSFSKELISRKRIDLQIYLDLLDKDSILDILMSSIKELQIPSDLAPLDIIDIFNLSLITDAPTLRNIVHGAADEAVQLGYSTVHISNYYHALVVARESVPWYAFYLEKNDINMSLMRRKAYEIAAEAATCELFYPGFSKFAGIYWFHGPNKSYWGRIPDDNKESFSEIEKSRRCLIMDAAPRMINIIKFGRIKKASWSDEDSIDEMLSDLGGVEAFNHAKRVFTDEKSNYLLNRYWKLVLVAEAERESLFLLKKNEAFVNMLAEEIYQKGFLLADQIQEFRRKACNI